MVAQQMHERVLLLLLVADLSVEHSANKKIKDKQKSSSERDSPTKNLLKLVLLLTKDQKRTNMLSIYPKEK